MTLKVSVVVPVWNPGRYLNRCVDSLLNQTLPPTDFETIFIDDGSTDGTSQHLDTLANTHPHFHVIHTPNSGWPGKPRNIGITHAQGQYIQFLDNDDSLGPEALQRLYHLGHTNDADIVIGKVTSDFRGVPHNIFRTTQPHCTIHDTPLIESLTPHKMFSKAFLDRNPDLRYPEERWILGDQMFVLKAYLAAKNVAILGDYPCYFAHERASDAAAPTSQPDASTYFANLASIFSMVRQRVTSRSLREAICERFLRNECLSHLHGDLLTWSEDDRERLLSYVRGTIDTYVDGAAEDRLPGAIRARSYHARRGRMSDLVAMARRFTGIRLRTWLDKLRWENNELVLSCTAGLVDDRGAPLPFERRAERVLIDARVTGEQVPDDVRDVTDEIAEMLVDVVIKERGSHVEFFVPGSQHAQVEIVDATPGRAQLALRVTARLNPMTACGGHPMYDGVWDLLLRTQAFGWSRSARLGSRRSDSATQGAVPTLVGPQATIVIPYWTTPYDNLSVSVCQPSPGLSPPLRSIMSTIDQDCCPVDDQTETVPVAVTAKVEPAVAVTAKVEPPVALSIRSIGTISPVVRHARL